MDGLLETLTGQYAEEAFNEVYPRSVGRGVVKAHQPMGRLPFGGCFIDVGIEIVLYDIEPLVRIFFDHRV
jgi:hypothetical protein